MVLPMKRAASSMPRGPPGSSLEMKRNAAQPRYFRLSAVLRPCGVEKSVPSEEQKDCVQADTELFILASFGASERTGAPVLNGFQTHGGRLYGLLIRTMRGEGTG
jgi:hypothetical protein